MKLTICIPTVVGREAQFEKLYSKLQKQVLDNKLENEVGCVFYKDDKEISIGEKRKRMYQAATGLFSAQIDDDDDVADDYVETLYNVITNNPNVHCIGYVERCIIDGIVKYSKISREFTDWETCNPNVDGFHYHRTPFFKVPIKTEICKSVGVSDMRFGEDHDFARRIRPHLESDVFIDKVMYYYEANSLTPEQHKERYGL